MADISSATKTTLLLTCDFGVDRKERRGVAPLNLREFNDLLGVLRRLSIPLTDLNSEAGRERFRADLEGSALFEGRVGPLLDRRDTLERALGRWQSEGVQVLDRTHPDYPERYHRLLADRAPPLLFGVGDISLLNSDTSRLAIVGGRDIDNETSGFAWSSGRRAAEQGITVVSGGARGVDRAAVDGSLHSGGTAAVVLPGDLIQVCKVRRFRIPLGENRLFIVSPYSPEETFRGENALGRNRLIYCLADVGLVVSARHGTGGTWSGATEALRRRWVPLYARQAPDAPDGNRALLERGAHPLPDDVVDDPARFAAWLEASIQSSPPAGASGPDSRQLGMFPDS